MLVAHGELLVTSESHVQGGDGMMNKTGRGPPGVPTQRSLSAGAGAQGGRMQTWSRQGR